MNLFDTSRQPFRSPWTDARLIHERAIALGFAIDRSTYNSYSSHARSYAYFCQIHNRPLDPTEENLSFYIVFMAHHISANSLPSYLSGICNQLECYFPDIRANRASTLVKRTLAGCVRLYGHEVVRKSPLTPQDLHRVLNGLTTHHDDLLFAAQLLTGFHALLRLGELVFPDTTTLRNHRKIALRHTVVLFDDGFGFLLPSHKADRNFEGSRIIIKPFPNCPNPLSTFKSYLSVRDARFPLKPELWLRANGSIPTRSWFIQQLRTFFPSDIAGQSMRAGGATTLAEAGVPSDQIQAIGRWASEAWKIYIRKNPVLITALRFGGSVGFW
jgi:hypothetical protein